MKIKIYSKLGDVVGDVAVVETVVVVVASGNY